MTKQKKTVQKNDYNDWLYIFLDKREQEYMRTESNSEKGGGISAIKGH